MEDDDRYTAYHEAAHAVMAYFAGRQRWGTITIVEDDDGRVGFCDWPDEPLRVEDSLRVTIAGAVAESRLSGTFDVDRFVAELGLLGPLWNYGDEVPSDDVKLLRVLRHPGVLETWFPGRPEDEAVRALWQTTAAYLDDSWPAVEAVAAALLDRKTISGDEARSIIAALIP